MPKMAPKTTLTMPITRATPIHATMTVMSVLPSSSWCTSRTAKKPQAIDQIQPTKATSPPKHGMKLSSPNAMGA